MDCVVSIGLVLKKLWTVGYICLTDTGTVMDVSIGLVLREWLTTWYQSDGYWGTNGLRYVKDWHPGRWTT